MTSPFLGKAAVYARYRIPYPPEAVAAVVRVGGLTGAEVVADLGSGTGLLAGALRAHARVVFGVEPAEDMRRAAEEALGDDERFRSVAGSGEETTLADHSIDVITCANSFHYFDPSRARAEARRILRAGGRVVLLFNDAPGTHSPFMDGYLAFLRTITPPQLSSTHAADEHQSRVDTFFAGAATSVVRGEQEVLLDWEHLRGLFLSTSMAPADGDTSSLQAIFDAHQHPGRIAYRLSWTCLGGEIN